MALEGVKPLLASFSQYLETIRKAIKGYYEYLDSREIMYGILFNRSG